MMKFFSKTVLWIVLVAFFTNSVVNPSTVQADVTFLPAPGKMVALTPSFAPPLMQGIKIYKNDPFKFDFIVDAGDDKINTQAPAFKEAGKRLISYFLASLTIPEKDMWVNLSPYEKDRIVPEVFGDTQMGKELLAQDYLLKQVTASLMYPEGDVGREFWKKIYTESLKRFGSINISVNTINKVWIVPDRAVVYENAKDNTVMLVESRLKVMLEEDYLALKQQKVDTAKANQQLSNDVIREIIIPALEKEVNEGRNFASLRQVYHALILATWYKNNLKKSILSKGYVDQSKIAGVAVDDKKANQAIYEQYIKSYRKGVYNYIKDEVDPATNTVVPKKYFSGGVSWSNMANIVADQAMSGATGVAKVKETLGRMMTRNNAVLLTVGLAVTVASFNNLVSQMLPQPAVQPETVAAATVEMPAPAKAFQQAVSKGVESIVINKQIKPGDTATHIVGKSIEVRKLIQDSSNWKIYERASKIDGAVSLYEADGTKVANPNFNVLKPGQEIRIDLSKIQSFSAAAPTATTPPPSDKDKVTTAAAVKAPAVKPGPAALAFGKSMAKSTGGLAPAKILPPTQGAQNTVQALGAEILSREEAIKKARADLLEMQEAIKKQQALASFKDDRTGALNEAYVAYLERLSQIELSDEEMQQELAKVLSGKQVSGTKLYLTLTTGSGPSNGLPIAAKFGKFNLVPTISNEYAKIAEVGAILSSPKISITGGVILINDLMNMHNAYKVNSRDAAGGRIIAVDELPNRFIIDSKSVLNDAYLKDGQWQPMDEDKMRTLFPAEMLETYKPRLALKLFKSLGWDEFFFGKKVGEQYQGGIGNFLFGDPNKEMPIETAAGLYNQWGVPEINFTKAALFKTKDHRNWTFVVVEEGIDKDAVKDSIFDKYKDKMVRKRGVMINWKTGEMFQAFDVVRYDENYLRTPQAKYTILPSMIDLENTVKARQFLHGTDELGNEISAAVINTATGEIVKTFPRGVTPVAMRDYVRTLLGDKTWMDVGVGSFGVHADKDKTEALYAIAYTPKAVLDSFSFHSASNQAVIWTTTDALGAIGADENVDKIAGMQQVKLTKNIRASQLTKSSLQNSKGAAVLYNPKHFKHEKFGRDELTLVYAAIAQTHPDVDVIMSSFGEDNIIVQKNGQKILIIGSKTNQQLADHFNKKAEFTSLTADSVELTPEIDNTITDGTTFLIPKGQLVYQDGNRIGVIIKPDKKVVGQAYRGQTAVNIYSEEEMQEMEKAARPVRRDKYATEEFVRQYGFAGQQFLYSVSAAVKAGIPAPMVITKGFGLEEGKDFIVLGYGAQYTSPFKDTGDSVGLTFDPVTGQVNKISALPLMERMFGVVPTYTYGPTKVQMEALEAKAKAEQARLDVLINEYHRALLEYQAVQDIAKTLQEEQAKLDVQRNAAVNMFLKAFAQSRVLGDATLGVLDFVANVAAKMAMDKKTPSADQYYKDFLVRVHEQGLKEALGAVIEDFKTSASNLKDPFSKDDLESLTATVTDIANQLIKYNNYPNGLPTIPAADIFLLKKADQTAAVSTASQSAKDKQDIQDQLNGVGGGAQIKAFRVLGVPSNGLEYSTGVAAQSLDGYNKLQAKWDSLTSGASTVTAFQALGIPVSGLPYALSEAAASELGFNDQQTNLNALQNPSLTIPLVLSWEDSTRVAANTEAANAASYVTLWQGRTVDSPELFGEPPSVYDQQYIKSLPDVLTARIAWLEQQQKAALASIPLDNDIHEIYRRLITVHTLERDVYVAKVVQVTQADTQNAQHPELSTPQFKQQTLDLKRAVASLYAQITAEKAAIINKAFGSASRLVNYNGWEKNLYPTLAQRNSGKAYMGTVDPVTGVAKTGRIFAIEDPAKGELADLNKKLITYNKSPVADGIRLLIDAAKQEAAWIRAALASFDLDEKALSAKSGEAESVETAVVRHLEVARLKKTADATKVNGLKMLSDLKVPDYKDAGTDLYPSTDPKSAAGDQITDGRNYFKVSDKAKDAVTGAPLPVMGRLQRIEDPQKGELADLTKKLETFKKVYPGSPIIEGTQLLIDADNQELLWIRAQLASFDLDEIALKAKPGEAESVETALARHLEVARLKKVSDATRVKALTILSTVTVKDMSNVGVNLYPSTDPNSAAGDQITAGRTYLRVNDGAKDPKTGQLLPQMGRLQRILDPGNPNVGELPVLKSKRALYAKVYPGHPIIAVFDKLISADTVELEWGKAVLASFDLDEKALRDPANAESVETALLRHLNVATLKAQMDALRAEALTALFTGDMRVTDFNNAVPVEQEDKIPDMLSKQQVRLNIDIPLGKVYFQKMIDNPAIPEKYKKDLADFILNLDAEAAWISTYAVPNLNKDLVYHAKGKVNDPSIETPAEVWARKKPEWEERARFLTVRKDLMTRLTTLTGEILGDNKAYTEYQLAALQKSLEQIMARVSGAADPERNMVSAVANWGRSAVNQSALNQRMNDFRTKADPLKAAVEDAARKLQAGVKEIRGFAPALPVSSDTLLIANGSVVNGTINGFDPKSALEIAIKQSKAGMRNTDYQFAVNQIFGNSSAYVGTLQADHINQRYGLWSVNLTDAQAKVVDQFIGGIIKENEFRQQFNAAGFGEEHTFVLIGNAVGVKGDKYSLSVSGIIINEVSTTASVKGARNAAVHMAFDHQIGDSAKFVFEAGLANATAKSLSNISIVDFYTGENLAGGQQMNTATHGFSTVKAGLEVAALKTDTLTASFKVFLNREGESYLGSTTAKTFGTIGTDITVAKLGTVKLEAGAHRYSVRLSQGDGNISLTSINGTRRIEGQYGVNIFGTRVNITAATDATGRTLGVSMRHKIDEDSSVDVGVNQTSQGLSPALRYAIDLTKSQGVAPLDLTQAKAKPGSIFETALKGIPRGPRQDDLVRRMFVPSPYDTPKPLGVTNKVPAPVAQDYFMTLDGKVVIFHSKASDAELKAIGADAYVTLRPTDGKLPVASNQEIFNSQIRSIMHSPYFFGDDPDEWAKSGFVREGDKILWHVPGYSKPMDLKDGRGWFIYPEDARKLGIETDSIVFLEFTAKGQEAELPKFRAEAAVYAGLVASTSEGNLLAAYNKLPVDAPVRYGLKKNTNGEMWENVWTKAEFERWIAEGMPMEHVKMLKGIHKGLYPYYKDTNGNGRYDEQEEKTIVYSLTPIKGLKPLMSAVASVTGDMTPSALYRAKEVVTPMAQAKIGQHLENHPLVIYQKKVAQKAKFIEMTDMFSLQKNEISQMVRLGLDGQVNGRYYFGKKPGVIIFEDMVLAKEFELTKVNGAVQKTVSANLTYERLSATTKTITRQDVKTGKITKTMVQTNFVLSGAAPELRSLAGQDLMVVWEVGEANQLKKGKVVSMEDNEEKAYINRSLEGGADELEISLSVSKGQQNIYRFDKNGAVHEKVGEVRRVDEWANLEDFGKAFIHERRDVKGYLQRAFAIDDNGDVVAEYYWTQLKMEPGNGGLVRGKALVGKEDQQVKNVYHFMLKDGKYSLSPKKIGTVTRREDVKFENIPAELAGVLRKDTLFFEQRDNHGKMMGITVFDPQRVKDVGSIKLLEPGGNEYVIEAALPETGATLKNADARNTYRLVSQDGKTFSDWKLIISASNMSNQGSVIFKQKDIFADLMKIKGIQTHQAFFEKKFAASLGPLLKEITGKDMPLQEAEFLVAKVDYVENGTTRYFIRVKGDPMARVLVFITSDIDRDAILSMEPSDPEARLSYEFTHLGLMYKSISDPETSTAAAIKDVGFESKQLDAFKKTYGVDLRAMPAFKQEKMVRITRYKMLSDDNEADLVPDQVRYLGVDSPLSVNYLMVDRGVARFMIYDRTVDIDNKQVTVPVGVTSGEVAIRIKDNTFMRETQYFGHNKDQQEYVYRLRYNFEDGLVSKDPNFYIGYRYKTGVVWEHNLDSEAKIYSRDGIPLMLTRVPETSDDVFNTLLQGDVLPEYLVSLFEMRVDPWVQGQTKRYIYVKEMRHANPYVSSPIHRVFVATLPNGGNGGNGGQKAVKPFELYAVKDDAGIIPGDAEHDFMSKLNNSPGSRQLNLTSSESVKFIHETEQIIQQLEEHGTVIKLKNGLPVPEVYEDPVRKHYQLKILDYIPWVKESPLLNQALTFFIYGAGVVLSTLTWANFALSRRMRQLMRTIRKYNINESSAEKLAGYFDDGKISSGDGEKENKKSVALARKISIALTLNGPLVLGGNLTTVEQQQKHIKTYFEQAGFSESEIEAILKLQGKVVFNSPSNDPRALMAAVDLSGVSKSIVEGTKQLIDLIEQQAKRNYPQAMVLQEMINNNLISDEDLFKKFHEIPDDYKGQMRWTELMKKALLASESKVLKMYKDMDPRADDELDRLLSTPSTRILKQLSKSQGLSDWIAGKRKTADEQAREEWTKKIEAMNLEQFGAYVLRDYINQQVDDVYNRTYKYAKDKSGNEIPAERLATAKETIFAEVHRFLSINPSLITDNKQDPAADPVFKPFPLTENLEPKTIQQMALLVFMQMPPSYTRGHSLGSLSLNSPTAMFVVNDVIAMLEALKSDDKQEKTAALILDRVKNQLVIWNNMFKINIWYEGKAPGIFMHITDPLQKQADKIRMSDIFTEQDQFGFFWSLISDKEKGREEYYRMIDQILREKAGKDQQGQGYDLSTPAAVNQRLKEFADLTNEMFDEYSQQVDHYKKAIAHAQALGNVAKEISKADAENNQTALKQAIEKYKLINQRWEEMITQGVNQGHSLLKLEDEKGRTTSEKGLDKKVKAVLEEISEKEQGEPKKAFDNLQQYFIKTIKPVTDVFRNKALEETKKAAPYAAKLDKEHKQWRGVAHLFIRHIGGAVFNLGRFWNFDDAPKWRKVVAFLTLAAGIAGSVTMVVLNERLLAWSFLVVALSFVWPAMLFGKARSSSEKVFWGLGYGVIAGYQFGLLTYHLFFKMALIQFATFGFWVTAFLFTAMIIPTFVSGFQMFNALLSNLRLPVRIWARSYAQWIGLRSLFRFSRDNSKLNLYKDILVESFEMEEKHAPMTPTGEPVRVWLKSVIKNLPNQGYLMTQDEVDAWTAFIENPEANLKGLKLPRYDKTREALMMLFFTFIQKKPIPDKFLSLQATSTNVQAAGELFFGAFEAQARPDSFALNVPQERATKVNILEDALKKFNEVKKGGNNRVLPRRSEYEFILERFEKAELNFDRYSVAYLTELFKDLGVDQDVRRHGSALAYIISREKGATANLFKELESVAKSVKEAGDAFKALKESGSDQQKKLKDYEDLSDDVRFILEGIAGRDAWLDNNPPFERLLTLADDISSVVKRLREADEFTNLYELLLELPNNAGFVVANKIEEFFSENQPNNSAVVRSMATDLVEYHVRFALEAGDYKYAEAVRDLAGQKGFISLKDSYDKLIRKGKQDDKDHFYQKYALYHDMVRLKYRPSFQDAGLWAKYVDQVDGVFIFKNFKELLKRSDDKKLPKVQALIDDLKKRLKDREILIDEETGLVKSKDLQTVAKIMLEVRKDHFETVIREDAALSKMGWADIVHIAKVIDITSRCDVYLPFYDPKTDNLVPNNKNGGIGMNLWFTYGRSANYDAWVRPYVGQNAYRLNWATMVGRNPEIVVVNPIMRIWASTSNTFPVTQQYAIAQHTWTSDTQRGREWNTTFYGKGLITPYAGDSMITPTGEDSAAFLMLNNLVPHALSTQIDWFGFEWGRPTQYGTIFTTEERYANNVTGFLEDRDQYALFHNPKIGYETKLTHLLLFMHYLGTLFGVTLIVTLPLGAMFSSFALLAPVLLWSVMGFVFVFGINFATIQRHLRETGSVFWSAIYTVRDAVKAFPMFVGIIPMLLKGVWSASNGVFKFFQTNKDKYLEKTTPKEHYKILKLTKFVAHNKPTFGNVLFWSGAASVAFGIITMAVFQSFVVPWGFYLAIAAGLLGMQAGAILRSKNIDRFPFYGIIGGVSFVGWVFTFFVSTPIGPTVTLIYGLAAGAALSSHYAFGPHFEKIKTQLKLRDKDVNVGILLKAIKGSDLEELVDKEFKQRGVDPLFPKPGIVADVLNELFKKPDFYTLLNSEAQTRRLGSAGAKLMQALERKEFEGDKLIAANKDLMKLVNPDAFNDLGVRVSGFNWFKMYSSLPAFLTLGGASIILGVLNSFYPFSLSSKIAAFLVAGSFIWAFNKPFKYTLLALVDLLRFDLSLSPGSWWITKLIKGRTIRALDYPRDERISKAITFGIQRKVTEQAQKGNPVAKWVVSTTEPAPKKDAAMLVAPSPAMIAFSRAVSEGTRIPAVSKEEVKPAIEVAPTKKGGIDLGPVKVKVENKSAIATAFEDSAMVELLMKADGITPVIYSIKPMTPAMAQNMIGIN